MLITRSTSRQSLPLTLALSLASVLALALLVPVGAAAQGSAADTLAPPDPLAPPPSPAHDRDGDGDIGEATAIRRRARLYHQMHGTGGRLTSTEMLRRTRWGYRRWLDSSRRRLEKGVEGNGWVSLGPTNGAGRCSVVAPHPNQVGTILAGAAGGGVWRTTDSGQTWYPLTDGLADLSVGAIAYAPSNPDIVYLGTGEAGFAIDFIPGIGLLRSDDGGDTWILPADAGDIVASQFYALSVHPDNPDSLLAATNEGLLASEDGGVTWDERLCHDDLAGVTEVVRSAIDPNLVYAALWCKGTCEVGLTRVMRSNDGGSTWLQAGDGLPATRETDTEMNRTSLTVAPSNDRILFAGMSDIDQNSGLGVSRIFRSDNGGISWHETSYRGNYLGVQGWYDNTITVHPSNPDVVVAGGIWYEVSFNGGGLWQTIDSLSADEGMGSDTVPHVDGHDLQWQGDTLWLACDGGIWSSADNGLTWAAHNVGLVTRQYYGLALDPMDHNRILAGTQDNETNLRLSDTNDSWTHVISGDGFECAINQLIPDIMFGTMYSTKIFRNLQHGVGEWADVSPLLGSGLAPFITTLTMRENQPWVLYTGSTDVWRSDDNGDTWQELPRVIESGTWSPHEIWSIAVTDADPRLIMISKEDTIYRSRDGGQLWRRVAEMETRVLHIQISPFDADVALACLVRADDSSRQIMRTDNRGETWQPSGSGLPPFPVQVTRWDPTDPSVVYAGTDLGLYRSDDRGLSWTEIGEGLPAVSVHDVRILPDGSKLAIATHGRGIWELAIDRPANTPPSITITSPGEGAAVALGDEALFTAQAADRDGDDLTVTWIFDRPWQAVTGGSGTGKLISSTSRTFDWSRSYFVAAHVSDGRGGSAFDSLHITASEPGDSCDTPRVIPPAGPFPYRLLTEDRHATIGADDPSPTCVETEQDEDSGRWGSLWFELTPAESNTYLISTCGSDLDTVLSVWYGSRCGPYTSLACNDDDEREHCWGERTDSYVEVGLAAGTTYQIMVGGWGQKWRGRVQVNVDCPTCSGAFPGYPYLIPAAAHADGARQTSWVTDVDLYNPNSIPVTAQVSFLPPDDDLAAEAETISLAAGSVRQLEDVVANLLQSEGVGALSVVASDRLFITSRTSNYSPQGIFGQGIPAVAADSALAPAKTVRLIGLAGTDTLRTNLGMANVDPLPASLTIELYDGHGELLATLQETLPPHGWKQLNRIFARLPQVETATAVIHNTSQEARLAVYASVVDEQSGDPSYVTTSDVATPPSPLWIPAAAHADGVGSSQWRTDLVLANTGVVDQTSTVVLAGEGSAAGSTDELPSVSIPIPAGESMMLRDVVASHLGTTGTGALRITVDQGTLMAGSRTYTDSDAGTYGQAIPGISAERAVGLGQSALLLQLCRDQAHRTNVGLVNPGEKQITVTAEYFDNHSVLLETKIYSLPPFSWYQDNGALPSGGAYAVLHSTTLGASFFTYASVVNNSSDDPVYIPAVVLPPSISGRAAGLAKGQDG